MSMWLLLHGHHSQPLPCPWPCSRFFSWFSSIHIPPFTAAFGSFLPAPKMLGFDDSGVVLPPLLYLSAFLLLFLSGFCSCSFLFLCGHGRFHPWRESLLCLLFLFVSPTLRATPPAGRQGSAQAPGSFTLLDRITLCPSPLCPCSCHPPSTSLLSIYPPFPSLSLSLVPFHSSQGCANMPPATQGPSVHTCHLFASPGVKNKPPCLSFLEQNGELETTGEAQVWDISVFSWKGRGRKSVGLTYAFAAG